MLNTRLNQSLLAILAAQLLLVAVVWGQGWLADDGVDSEPLLTLTREQVRELRIHDTSGETERQVTLARADDAWRLQRDAGTLPAEAGRVDALLSPLEEARLTWPVADNEDAAERFETGEDNYQYRLTLLTADGDERQLYLGTSPAYGKVHVRRDDEQAVHAIDLNVVDVAAKPDRWLDASLMQIDADALDSVQLGERTVERADDAWQTDKGPFNPNAWKEWLQRWSTLRVSGLAEEEQVAGLERVEPELTVHFQGDTDTRVTVYHLEDQYLIRRSDLNGAFELPAGTAKALVKTEPLWSRADSEVESDTAG